MFVLVCYSRLGGKCAGQDASCNHGWQRRCNHGWQRRFRQSDSSATTVFSAATLQYLLIAVLAIAGVMTMGGGLLLFGFGFSAASQSLVGPLQGIWLIPTSVRWVNESLTRPVGPVRSFRAFESAPPRSLTGPAAVASRTAHGRAVSRQGSVPAAAA
jgi:hypothetical protein